MLSVSVTGVGNELRVGVRRRVVMITSIRFRLKAGERVGTAVDPNIIVRCLAAKPVYVYWKLNQCVGPIKHHLIGCHPVLRPTVLAVVQGDDASKLPAVLA